ncbi:MAG: PID-CTERM protein-sorting domain-containing protein [Bacteroidota bacterium]
MKNKFLATLPVTALIVFATSPLFAQSCNPNVPIDGGLSALLVAGAGYGIKKINEKKKEK